LRARLGHKRNQAPWCAALKRAGALEVVRSKLGAFYDPDRMIKDQVRNALPKASTTRRLMRALAELTAVKLRLSTDAGSPGL
jgi:ribosomal protein L13